MIWQDSYLLFLLILVPLALVGSYLTLRASRKRRAKFFDENIFQGLYHGQWSLGRKLNTFFYGSGLVLLIVSVAGPKIGTEVREV